MDAMVCTGRTPNVMNVRFTIFLQDNFEKKNLSSPKTAKLACAGIIVFGAKAPIKIAMGGLMGPAAHRGPDQEAAFSPGRESGLGLNRCEIINPERMRDHLSWSPDGGLFFALEWERVYLIQVSGRQTPKNGVID